MTGLAVPLPSCTALAGGRAAVTVGAARTDCTALGPPPARDCGGSTEPEPGAPPPSPADAFAVWARVATVAGAPPADGRSLTAVTSCLGAGAPGPRARAPAKTPAPLGLPLPSPLPALLEPLTKLPSPARDLRRRLAVAPPPPRLLNSRMVPTACCQPGPRVFSRGASLSSLALALPAEGLGDGTSDSQYRRHPGSAGPPAPRPMDAGGRAM